MKMQMWDVGNLAPFSTRLSTTEIHRLPVSRAQQSRGWVVTGNAESHMRHSATGAVLLLSLLSPGALAQSPTAPPVAAPNMPTATVQAARASMRAACAGDVQKFCAGAERGNGGLRDCLRSHRAELSSDCNAARASLRSLRSAAKAKDKD